MSTPLEKAFEEARKLSASEQEALAALILEEIADESGWAKTFAASQDKLGELADEALREIAAGRATPLELPPRK
jgi:hypothetical protein